MLKQKTLKDSFSLSGKGLHTGLDLTVTFNPAPDNHGYKIQRIDVEGQPTIDAVADNVTETTRGTVLSKNGVKVSTVEHGMAALYALGIDNCLIQVNGPEFPILDGSAQYYVQEIERVGTEEQSAVKDFYIIKSKIEFRDESTGSSIIVLPDENFSLNVLVSYDSTIIPNQFATLEDMHNFKDEVAASRTFVFVREIEPLLSAGLIKGGDLDNAIVIYERKMSQESFDKLADVMRVPHMDAEQLGYINHKPLVWANECARHKLLDVIGDLALIGKPIKGRIIATRPGHTINNKFARQMRKEIRLHEIQAPSYDCNREPVMDVNRIRELLPHRYPFQLVDKVIEIGANYIVGIKNITANEPFFQGHFPPGTGRSRRVAHRSHGSDRRSAHAQQRRRPHQLLDLLHENRQRKIPPKSGTRRHGHLPCVVHDRDAPRLRLHERLCICRRQNHDRSRIHGTNFQKQIKVLTLISHAAPIIICTPRSPNR